MFKRILIVFLGAAMLAGAGCDSADEAQAPQMKRYTMTHDGQLREYFVFTPSSYDSEAELPMAIFMHGYGGTATGTEAEVTQGLNQYAEEYGYVMVYPQGTWFMASIDEGEPWEVTSWNHISDGFDTGPAGPICKEDVARSPCPPECGDCGQCGWSSCNDDVGFLKSLVGVITATFAVDADRVFVSGFSNGAMMANRIGCEASELFAGVALIGGRIEPGFECTPTRRLPLLQINGGADETVPHDGRVSLSGHFFASTTSTTEHWNKGEACSTETEVWSSPTIEGENVQCTIACGETQYPSIDCIWPEGNHRWPGTADFRGSNGYCVTELQAASMPDQTICIAPEEDTNFWGSRLMFEFFNDYQGE